MSEREKHPDWAPADADELVAEALRKCRVYVAALEEVIRG